MYLHTNKVNFINAKYWRFQFPIRMPPFSTHSFVFLSLSLLFPNCSNAFCLIKQALTFLGLTKLILALLGLCKYPSQYGTPPTITQSDYQQSLTTSRAL